MDRIKSILEYWDGVPPYTKSGLTGTRINNHINEFDNLMRQRNVLIRRQPVRQLQMSSRPTPDSLYPEEPIINPNNPIQLKEVTVTAKAPIWLKYKQAWEKENPFDVNKYVENRFNNPVGREKIEKIDQGGWRKKLKQEGLEKRYNSAMDYVGEQFVKNKPQGDLSRAEWLNQMTDKEEEIIKRNPKYQSSLWADTKRGLISLVEQNPLQAFQNILNSSDYTNREKQEMLKDYIDHPIMSKLGDAAKILNPLIVPSKMVQSTYMDDYSFTDALKGKKNSAGIIEDIVTDPLNLVGAGLFGKISKADKVIDATKAGSKVLIKPVSKVVGKTDDVTKVGSKVLNKTDELIPLASSIDNGSKQVLKQPWQLQEMPGLHLKSTMEGQAISKIVEPKTGLVNVEQALAIIGKESGGANKVALVRQGLGESIPKKMDYNQFRKIVQDNLIPLEKQFSTHRSSYGISRLGYKNNIIDPKRLKDWQETLLLWENKLKKAKKTKDIELAKKQVDSFKKDIARWTENIPLENQTLILGNKSKFGRGSSAHGNPEETLGHIHFLIDAETPDVLTVTQIQSDAFQGTHRIMPKTQLDEASAKNFTQKQLLDKNHQERYLQELVDYAGKRGDVNKVRLPTSETAAKVQGYSMNYQELKKISGYGEETIIESVKLKEKGLSPEDAFNVMIKKYNTKPSADDWSRFKEFYNKDLKMSYSSEHQTILKKYKNNPKLIKKLFGQEPKIVTDSKGNTWYEFDIPKKFKEGKGEIKAFTVTGAIGSGMYFQSQNKNKRNNYEYIRKNNIKSILNR